MTLTYPRRGGWTCAEVSLDEEGVGRNRVLVGPDGSQFRDITVVGREAGLLVETCPWRGRRTFARLHTFVVVVEVRRNVRGVLDGWKDGVGDVVGVFNTSAGLVRGVVEETREICPFLSTLSSL